MGPFLTTRANAASYWLRVKPKSTVEREREKGGVFKADQIVLALTNSINPLMNTYLGCTSKFTCDQVMHTKSLDPQRSLKIGKNHSSKIHFY